MADPRTRLRIATDCRPTTDLHANRASPRRLLGGRYSVRHRKIVKTPYDQFITKFKACPEKEVFDMNATMSSHIIWSTTSPSLGDPRHGYECSISPMVRSLAAPSSMRGSSFSAMSRPWSTESGARGTLRWTLRSTFRLPVQLWQCCVAPPFKFCK